MEVIRVNVDGAFDGKSQSARVGFVVRNSVGICLAAIGKPTDPVSIQI